MHRQYSEKIEMD